MNQTISNKPPEPNAEETEVIKSLLNYPSLEKLFGDSDSKNLAATRQKMQSAIDDLERVIRRGTKEDAEKAATTIKAIKIVLSFLDELENRRQAQAQ